MSKTDFIKDLAQEIITLESSCRRYSEDARRLDNYMQQIYVRLGGAESQDYVEKIRFIDDKLTKLGFPSD